MYLHANICTSERLALTMARLVLLLQANISLALVVRNNVKNATYRESDNVRREQQQRHYYKITAMIQN